MTDYIIEVIQNFSLYGGSSTQKPVFPLKSRRDLRFATTSNQKLEYEGNYGKFIS